MLHTAYIERRSQYHWVFGLALALFGLLGYTMVWELTRQAEAQQSPIYLNTASFTLPFALLLAVIPLVLEIMFRSKIFQLSEKAFIALLVLIPVLMYGWTEFSQARFESWLSVLGYERCEGQDIAAMLPHQAWVTQGSCITTE